MYRSSLGLSSTAGAVEVGLGKEDRNGGSRTSGRSGGTGAGGAVAGARATLDDTVREAEDLEALLDGGYLEEGGERRAGSADIGVNGNTSLEKGGTDVGANGRRA